MGSFNWALVAGPLSPLKPAVPFPATVVITPFDDLADAVVTGVGDVEVAGGVYGDAFGDWFNWALMAGPLSPLKPGVPFPATVVITPSETLRTRLLPGVGDVQVAGGVHGDALGRSTGRWWLARCRR